MAFLGSLLGGIAGAVSTVAPIVSAVQTVGTLFRGAPTQQFQANLPSSPTWTPWTMRRHWQIPSRMSLVQTKFTNSPGYASGDITFGRAAWR